MGVVLCERKEEKIVFNSLDLVCRKTKEISTLETIL